MDALRVNVLLALWEQTVAPLRACKAALDETEWNASLARAKMDALEIVVAPRAKSDTAPNVLIASYKERARTHRDVRQGTLPRSLVWVTEQKSKAPPRVAPWERHRSFLGAPAMRGLIAGGDAIHWAGSMRIERDVNQLPDATADRESLLALYDVRWTLDHMTRFSRRTGTRVAVELRGVTGWVDHEGCDQALEGACARFLDVVGVGRAEMSPAFDALDADAVRALLDDLPNRRKNVADCEWAALIEADLQRTADVLRDVDLDDDTNAAGAAAIRELEVAMGSGTLGKLGVARSRYATNASFPDVLDRLLVERDLIPIGNAWREVSPEEARATWHEALTTSLAYGSPLLTPALADRLISAFVGSFERAALFFSNHTGAAYRPVLGSTFEQGAAVIDTDSVGYLFLGDED